MAWSKADKLRVMDAVLFAADYYCVPVPLVRFRPPHQGDWSLDLDGEYVICISKYPTIDEIRMVVFHEMCHVKQYEYDGLELTSYFVRWDGLIKHLLSIDPYVQEWEVEARNAETILANIYNEGLNSS